MRPGTTEYAIMVNFNYSLYPHFPLGTEDKLSNPDLPFGISFIYGQNDWTRVVDDDFAKIVCEKNKFESSKFHEVPDSDHNMHMDNPSALAALMINDLLGLNLPVLTLKEQENNFAKIKKVQSHQGDNDIINPVDNIDYEKDFADI